MEEELVKENNKGRDREKRFHEYLKLETESEFFRDISRVKVFVRDEDFNSVNYSPLKKWELPAS